MDQLPGRVDGGLGTVREGQHRVPQVGSHATRAIKGELHVVVDHAWRFVRGLPVDAGSARAGQVLWRARLVSKCCRVAHDLESLRPLFGSVERLESRAQML